MVSRGMVGTGSLGEGTPVLRSFNSNVDVDVRNKLKEEHILDANPISTMEQQLNYESRGV